MFFMPTYESMAMGPLPLLLAMHWPFKATNYA